MVFYQQSIPFKEYTVRAGQFIVNCREAGEGLPVIFLETLRWGHRDLYDALGKNFHLFVLEFETAEVEGLEERRRAERKPFPLTDEELEAEIAKVEIAKVDGAESAVRELAKNLAGDSYNLMGVSQGANLALRTVLRAPMDPEPAESLVLISPNSIRPDPDLWTLNWVGWTYRLFAHKDRQVNLGGLPNGWDLAPMFLPKDTDSELEEWLPEVKCPTLAVLGTKDRMTLREAASTYRANIPNCHVSLVYDAGHLAVPERPDAVANAAIDFIENRETFVVNRQSSVINP